MGLFAFGFQIYFDFSGYSDMAIGLGRIFGFRFNENFDYPYLAASVTEFWRRWHMSLTTWFREYLYIPRRKEETLARNRAIFRDYTAGLGVDELSARYFLAPKSIQRILTLGRRGLLEP